MTMTESATNMEMLLPPLRRLDTLLERAVKAADSTYGSSAAADPYRGLYISTEDAQRLLVREPASPLFGSASPVPQDQAVSGSPLAWMQGQFGLTDFDMDTIVVSLAPEVDLRYERLYAYLQDDVTRRRPSVDLALNLLCASRESRWKERARFAPNAPLISNHLLHLIPDAGQAQPPLLAHFLKLDEAAVRVLLGQPCLDSRIASFCRLDDPSAGADELAAPAQTRQALLAMVDEAGRSGGSLRLYFLGVAGTGQAAAARLIAQRASQRLLRVDLARALAAGGDFETSVALLFREALLLNAVAYLEGLDALRGDDRAIALQTLMARVAEARGLVILAGEQPLPAASSAVDAIPVSFGVPDFEGRREYWQARLAAARIPAAGADLDGLAGSFRLTPDQIDGAIATAKNQSRLRAAEVPGGSGPAASDLFSAARAQSSAHLGSLARKIEPLYTWNDIVLPADQIQQLREICSQARHRNVVFGDWGFDRKLSLGKGLSVLFSGPPGTGKTMAAEIVANELRLGLYKIDLSQVVSKYIGETEKNLNRIFAEARTSNAIIFFDEADALFGKRSEVRDAHDRYANIEIAYLLQKMEEYEGISILATNLRQNLDQAFTRRLSFSIDFPFPDEASRLLIWQSIWPPQAPLDKSADLRFMAAQYKLCGGSVKNIAVAASFMAVEDGANVKMAHLLRATRREFQKIGKNLSKPEFGPYWDLMGMTA